MWEGRANGHRRWKPPANSRHETASHYPRLGHDPRNPGARLRYAAVPRVDSDAATLLTSELVTNAIQHTDSGARAGTVTIVVIGVPEGVLVEVVDDGSADTPVVKGSWCAAEGQGLFLVQQLATRWGFLRDPAGTTVWFHLQAATAASTPAQLAATTSPLVTYGGIV